MHKLTTLAVAIASLSLMADTRVWTGGTDDSNWNDAGNFDNGVPVLGDTVVIPAGQTAKLAAGDSTSLGIVSGLAVLRVDGTFVTSPTQTTKLNGLYGSGLVTNEVASGYKNLELLSGFHDFSGRIAGRIYLLVKGNAILSGTDNDIRSADTPFSVQGATTSVTDIEKRPAVGVGVAQVAKFGNAGEPSSVGASPLRTLNRGGGFIYLGNGETTDQEIDVVYPAEGPSFLDGGANGGLVWKGPLCVKGNGMTRFCLLGSNETACVFSGAVTSREAGGTNYTFFVEKAGTGVWRMADTDNNKKNRAFWSSMAVRGGTLQFDSMAEVGKPCALGLATNQTAVYVGMRDDAANLGPYAYWLGRDGRTVSFEYTGTNGVCVTGRPIALEGDAKLVNSTAHAWRFSGVNAVGTGARKLYLSGSGTGANEIAGIGEAAGGPISVIKEGAGTWTLNGSNTFSGTLSVNEGTLRIRGDAAYYTWFKWTVQNKCDSTASWLYLCELGLYDKDGARLAKGLTLNDNWHDMAAGQVAFARDDMLSVYKDRNLTKLVDGSTDPANVGVPASYDKYNNPVFEVPTLNTPETWFPVLVRLPEGANPANYYDVCIHYGNAAAKNYRYNPNAWMLEGSVDGIHWDTLHATNNVPLTANSYVWANAGTTYYNNTEAGTSGVKIAATPSWHPPAVFTNSVSVAVGATLEAIGDVALSSVRVDPSSKGTISGFALAENGTLDVTGLPQDGALGVLFTNVKGLENLTKWAVAENGRIRASRKIEVSASGEVRVVRSGLMLIVR